MNNQVVEGLRWLKFPVLGDGFICLVDCMGDDAAIVQAARVSYGEGTKKTSDDRTLIRYLMRHRHSTPFEMVELKFLVRVPMDCWRQWIRHRTASVNEYSTRYSLAIDEMQTTPPDCWRLQATQNRQGSDGNVSTEIGQKLTHDERHFHEQARKLYSSRIEAGVAREQARKDLPLSTFTEAYWKIDLHNLLHFLALRCDEHAQQEIRFYAQTIAEKIVAPLFPAVWEAFVDFRRNALQLTGPEVRVVQRLAGRTRLNTSDPWTEADFLAVQDPEWAPLARCRERDECRNKLVELGLLASYRAQANT